MTITTTTLTRAAGLCAVAAGLLFIGVQINHPHLDAAFVTTTEWTVRQTVKVLMAVLSLVGITGMYLRQVKQTGVLGLLGYLVFGAGYLIMLEHRGRRCVRPPDPSPAVHPATSTTSSPWPPAATPTGDIGLMQTLSLVSGFTYLAAASSSASRCSAPTSSPGGLQRSSPSAPSPPSPSLCCRSSTNGCSPSHRRRPDRPRLLAVARPAHHGRSSLPRPRQLAARPGRRQVTTQRCSRAARSTRSTGWVPFALVALVLVPAISRLAAAGRAGRRPARSCRRTPASPPRPCRWSCTSSAPSRTPSSAPSSSPPRCGAAGRAGTGRPDGSWWCWAWRWRSRRCG